MIDFFAGQTDDIFFFNDPDFFLFTEECSYD